MESNYNLFPGSSVEMDFLNRGRKEVEVIIEASKTSPPQMTLFLQDHFPFFDKSVQAILLERPVTHPISQNALAYPIDGMFPAMFPRSN